VIATAGRLCDLLSRRLVNLDAVRILVLDEADRMGNPGEGERDSVTKLNSIPG
jgi:superfamily II DNA/RNA helicase